VVRQPGDWVALKTEARFLRAEPDGRIVVSQAECGACEMFTLAKQPHSSEVFDALGLMTPYEVAPFNKKRIGWARDGGYVLLDDFDDVGPVYSIEIGGQVSFDETLANARQAHLYVRPHDRTPPRRARQFPFFAGVLGCGE